MEEARYTVGWIAPLPLELTAAKSALEEEYGDIHIGKYSYCGGRIGSHNVVIGVQSRMGTDAASDLAARMRAAFPNLDFFVVVGIGGGVPRYGPPGAVMEMALGDVVVSSPRGSFNGVIRSDSGAWEGQDEGRLSMNGHTYGPPDALLGAVSRLHANHNTGSGTKIPNLLKKMRLIIHKDERHKFEDQGPDRDRLFQDELSHPTNSYDVDCQQCCDFAFLQLRQDRGPSAVRQTDTPRIHYGNIASSNQLQISTAMRNKLQKEYGIICFEMEGAGVIQRHPCLIVRGICDYSDSHKNKTWQPYAAVTAAAYTRELLESMPSISFAGNLPVLERRDFDKLLSQLRTTDPHDDKKRIEGGTRGGLMMDAYRWILSNSEFQQWRDDKQSRVLWITGDPGKGKTMLLCGIIDELERSIGHQDLLCYFFCQNTDSRINNAKAVLRGLLYVLIRHQPSLISHVQKKHDHAAEALFQDANAWVALCEIFTNILQDPNLRRTYLVIDALDECVAEDLPKLLDFIVEQSSVSTRVKWLISSRNWPVIIERLEKMEQRVRLSLELNADSVSAAVGVFIQQQVLRLSHENKYDDKTREEVERYLFSNANSTFLWVSLVCRNLKGVAKRHIIKKLHAFPPGLDSFYERMIRNISESDDADVCSKILAIAATVYRPITVEELVTLVKELEDVADDLETIREIIGYCGSFLTLRENIIYFVHQSAKDFLLEKASSNIFPSGMEEAHYTAFSRSLTILSTKALKRDMYGLVALGCPIEEVGQPDPDPLAKLRYSCIYWIDHLCDCSGSANYSVHLQDDGSVDWFLRNKFLYWLEAISLCKSMPKGVVAMAKLEELIHNAKRASNLLQLVRDAGRFVMYHKVAIENAPLQAYVSALAFSPRHSLIRKCYKREAHPSLTVKPAMISEWSACIQTLEGHNYSVNSVAFSHNSTQLASASGDQTIKIWDTSSGACLQTLEGHSDSVHSVAFSHNSTQLASAS